MSDPAISALVVAHNEAHQIAECLAGLGFADEIVVVLDRYTDDTGAIAARHGAAASRRRMAGRGRPAQRRNLRLSALLDFRVGCRRARAGDARRRSSSDGRVKHRRHLQRAHPQLHRWSMDSSRLGRPVRNEREAVAVPEGRQNLWTAARPSASQGDGSARSRSRDGDRASYRSRYFRHDPPFRPLYDGAGRRPARAA